MELFYQAVDSFARIWVYYLLNGIWISLLVVGMLVLLLFGLKHAPAALRHRMYWLGVISVVLLPMLFLLGVEQSVHEKIISEQVFEVFQGGADQVLVQVPQVLSNGLGTSYQAINHPSHWPLYVAGVWLVGAIFLSARLVWQVGSLYRLEQLGFWHHADVQLWFEQCKRRWAGGDVKLRFATQIRGPVAIGLSKPIILMPEGLLRHLSKEEVEQVLVHELAHIDRNDIWGTWVQRFVEVVFWFNPVIWMLSKQLSVSREMACDDWAIRFGYRRKQYARCLARLAEMVGVCKSPVVGVGGGSSLRRRIEYLLQTPQNMGWFTKGGIWLGGVLALVICVVCIQYGPRVDVPGRAEAYLRVAQWNETLAKLIIGNPMPRGIGLSNKVVVVAAEEHWPWVKVVAEDLFMEPVYTPQPEYVFEVVYVLPEALDDYRAYRNLILVGTADEKIGEVVAELGNGQDFFIQQDVWASHQVVVGVGGNNLNGLRERISIEGDRIASAIDAGMNDWLSSLLYHAGVDAQATETLGQEYGWQIKVPVGFNMVQGETSEQLVAFTKNVDRRQMWMWVYWEDGINPDQLEPDWCLKKRNTVLEQFYGADKTSLGDLKIYEAEFAGRLAVCLEGLWENNKSWQGGPFKSYAMIDADKQRFYMIDTAIYAPNRSKVLQLRQLDALARTFELAPTYAAK